MYLFKSYFFIKKDLDTPRFLLEDSHRQWKFHQHSKGDDEEPISPTFEKASILTNVYTWRDDEYSSFMMAIMHHLQPRQYLKHEVIYEENEEVSEIIFVCSGEYSVGYMIGERDRLVMKIGNRTAIGDY